MARFFIDRPIFAWVLSIMLMGLGILSIFNLPIAQYPQIAPPTVAITATYPGASADTIANTVTQVIEQQMTGLDGLRYFSSTSTSAGSATITLTFATGTDADIAQVQVQNKLSTATALLPEVVQEQGLTVAKSTSGFLMVIALVSDDESVQASDLSDYVSSSLADEISRINGVGSLRLFGSQYAMRIWLDPAKLAAYDLTTSDVVSAVSDENAQISAGAFGELPAITGQQLNATITAQSLLQTPEDFRQIVLKAETDGGLVLLGDVARVEIGSESYSVIPRYKRAAAGGFAVSLASDGNALETATAVEERMEELSEFFPQGVRYVVPYNTAPFIRISIEEVIKTLAEAIVLVFFVMLLFLQNIRATLIPTLAIPVVLMGTFAILSLAGFSINTLTMLAMVLAIGLLVDDAVVVVENVERIMEEEGLSPLEATRKSMDQVSSALIGIAVVVSAVFIPMAFFGGSTGIIYKQFAVTIVSAMVLSVFVALTLTPALCATLLKAPNHSKQNKVFGTFNRGFSAVQKRYTGSVGWISHRPFRMGIIYLAIAGAMTLLFLRTPTGFLPAEDQGILFTLIQTPTGSTAERTLESLKKVEDFYLDQESDIVDGAFGVVGFSFAGTGQNMGILFIQLKDWSERTSPAQSVQALAGRAFGALSQIEDARVFPIVPPSVIALGNVSGFDFFLQGRGGQTHEQLVQARGQLLGALAQSPLIASARPNGLEDAAQFNLDLDFRKAGALGVSASDISSLLTTAWAGSFVNDFLDQGRTKKVYVQGEASARSNPNDFDQWRVRNATDGLVPLSEFSKGEWTYGPQGIYRYNGVSAMQIQGSPAPGVSTGEAIAEIQRLAADLPAGFNISLTGLSLEEEESGGQTPLLFTLALMAVFLALAALYESWSVPFAVMLAMPIGILGALLGAWVGGFDNGVFFQIGLLAVMGLTGKNAILIVEFAKDRRAEGMELYQAVSEAARQRFRPILMTSIAFSLGVLPLVLSSGAGSGGRTAIGSGVLGGTITATILGVLFVPLFFVIIARLTDRKTRTPST